MQLRIITVIINKRNKAFEHVQNVQIHFILHMRKALSGPLHFV